MTYQITKCENCGEPGGLLVWQGYNCPLPDVAPTHHEWQMLFLCLECQQDPEVRKHFGLDRKEGGATD